MRRAQTALAAELDEQPFVAAMRSERAFVHGILQAVALGKIDMKSAMQGLATSLGGQFETAMLYVPGNFARQHAWAWRVWSFWPQSPARASQPPFWRSRTSAWCFSSRTCLASLDMGF